MEIQTALKFSTTSFIQSRLAIIPCVDTEGASSSVMKIQSKRKINTIDRLDNLTLCQFTIYFF